MLLSKPSRVISSDTTSFLDLVLHRVSSLL